MNAPDASAPPAGVLVVDKPTGISSHDAVARVRRLLGLRRVGHAGTLDPLASGVLVVMVGEATKLAPFLTIEDKRYEAVLCLGLATTTLDAEGEVTEACSLPEWLLAETTRTPQLAKALELERARQEQLPPRFSAIKVGGRTGYARARAGEQFELSPRQVRVDELELESVEFAEARGAKTALVRLNVSVGKGYYVRSLARDFGAALGVPAHLGALRRTQSGPFELAHAVSLASSREQLLTAMIPLGRVARLALPATGLTDLGTEHVRKGQPVPPEHFESEPPRDGPSAWFDGMGELVAVGELRSDGYGRVVRGFSRPSPATVAAAGSARYDEAAS